jgi:hypothetical protein
MNEIASVLEHFHRNSVLDARLMSSHGGRLYPEERTASADVKPSTVFTSCHAVETLIQ